MPSPTGPPIPGWKQAVERLSSSQIFWIVTILFLVDLAIPDPLPFVDEALLGLLWILVGRWQLGRGGGRGDDDGGEAPKPPPKNVTPPGR